MQLPGCSGKIWDPSACIAKAHEVEALRAAGLARGGSLENSIVVGDENTGILNEGGLRYENEFARHKVLDCVGDLYLAGKPLLARVEAHRSGHELNNALLKKLFSDEENWSLEFIPIDSVKDL